jgi:hypothetical protein
MHFIMNTRLLKSNIWTNKLIGLLKKLKIYNELYSKLFIVIKHGLKNEIINLNVNFFCETLTKW